MSSQAYLENVEEKTGKTPNPFKQKSQNRSCQETARQKADPVNNY